MRIATDLIEKYHRSELEAARILAYMNAAAFDAIIACFDVKFTYWFIRPTKADPTITLATAAAQPSVVSVGAFLSDRRVPGHARECVSE